MSNADQFIGSYLSWLRQNITGVQLESGAIEITTPFLDRHNDYIQIYVKKETNGYLLSDEGYTISDLEMSGIAFTSSRKKQLDLVLMGFGVDVHDGVIFCKTTAEDFPKRKHNLLQALVTVNDMYVLSHSNVANVFISDVADYLTEHDIRFIRDHSLIGVSGYGHNFNIAIPQSKESPERLLRVTNTLDREKTSYIIFSWQDTAGRRSKNTKLYVVCNDNKKEPPSTSKNALEEYGIILLPWSKKEDYIPELSA